MHRDYRPGSGRYHSVELCRLHIEAARIHVGEGQCCAACCNTSGSRNTGVRGGDYFIARPDSAGSQGHVDSFGSRPYPYYIAAAKIYRELAFEARDFLAKYEPTPPEHAADGLVYIFPDETILPRQVAKRNSHPHPSSGSR